MPYVEQNWVNGPAGNTPLDDVRLNHVEDGLSGVANTLDGVVDAVNALIAGKSGQSLTRINGGPTSARPAPTLDAIYRDHDLNRVIYGTGSGWAYEDGSPVGGSGGSNAPQGFTATVQPDNSVICTWSPVSGVTSYKLYEVQSPSGVAGATALTTTTTTRAPGTFRTYDYWVTALVNGVESAPSNHATAVLPYGGNPTGAGSPSALLHLGTTGGFWNLGIGYPTGHVDQSYAALTAGGTWPPNFLLNTAGTAVVFQVGANGAVDGAASPYPRCELREMNPDGLTKAAWTANAGTHSLEFSFKVNHLQPLRPQVLVGHIVNSAGVEAVAIRVTGTTTSALDVVARIGGGDDHATKLVIGYALGTLVKIKLELLNGLLNIYANDVLKITATTLNGTVTTTGAGSGQRLGVGGVATPTGAILATGNTGDITISTSGSSGNPRVYDGKGFTCGRITISADWVTVQNYYVKPRSQYGVYMTGNNITLQNCDIKDVMLSGDGDLNAITLFGDNIRVLYNTCINYITGDPGSSHTDAIQTWNTSSHRSTSGLWVIGNRFEGPLQSEGVAPIHQCIMGEGAQSTDGGGGGSGASQNWHVEGNYFRDSWNQTLKFDDIDNVNVTRNTFAGNSNHIMEVTSLSTGVKYYSDNIITGNYANGVGYTVTSGAGPASPLGPAGGGTTTTTTVTALTGCYFRAGAYPQSSNTAGGFESPAEYCNVEHSGLVVVHNPALGTTVGPAPADGVQAAALLNWGAVIDGDEFEYTGPPNSSKWSMYDGPGHAGNGIRSPGAFSVGGGILTCYGDNVNGGTTGGMAFNRSEMYCRAEWRVRAYSINPSGGGNKYHPVLIYWPTNDSWPQGGEYDFYEVDCDTGLYEAYLHIPGNDGSAQEYASKSCDIQNWHNIAFEWSPSGIKGWLDGVQVFAYSGAYILAPGPMQPTFQMDNFFGSNMAPAKFEAMWFRIYTKPA